jgi:hypothetical protein
MIKYLIYTLLISAFFFNSIFSQNELNNVTSKDTSYISIANSRILNLVKKGKPAIFTLQVSFNYNIGHMDLAGNENTVFSKNDFVLGKNFGTRYGYGSSLIGKISLHKQGNLRLNISAGFNRFQSNFVISESPEGKAAYNVFSGGLGLENNFTPAKKFKPFISFEITANLINGNAELKTDSSNFSLKIKNAFRVGAAFTFGFEYAFNNNFGINFGYKITHSNLIGKESKESSVLTETYLNDNKVTGNISIPYAGWKQFLYSTFYTGINIYFGLRNKK